MNRGSRYLGLLSVLMGALVPAPAWAQEDGGSFVLDASLPDSEPLDAMVPDASVGEGGADRDNQENEDGVGKTQLSCRGNGDCDRGFYCQANRCTYSGFRKADNGGCMLGLDAAMVAIGIVLATRRRYSGKS